MSGKSSLCPLCYTKSNHHRRQHLPGPTLPPQMGPILPHKARKERLGGHLGGLLEPSRTLLRPSWGTLGGSLGGPGGISGASWGVLKSSQREGDLECDLEATWSRLGAVLGRLGAILWSTCGRLGAILGPPWGSWGALGASWAPQGAVLTLSWTS